MESNKKQYERPTPRALLDEFYERASGIYTNPDMRDTGGSLANLFMERSHHFLETTAPPCPDNPTILELGASDRRHLNVVPDYSKYVLSDKTTELLDRDKTVLPENVEIIALDACDLIGSLPGSKFDRIICCNLWEHLRSPEIVLLEWYDALNEGGVLSLLQPCDPGILWRLGRNFGPRRGLNELGVNYDLLMSLEHINPISNLLVISEELFSAKTSFFPFKIRSWNFNLFAAIHITKKEG